MELNLAAAKIVCTRKAHSRTANIRYLHDSTAEPLRKIERKAQAAYTLAAHRERLPREANHCTRWDKPEPQQSQSPTIIVPLQTCEATHACSSRETVNTA